MSDASSPKSSKGMLIRLSAITLIALVGLLGLRYYLVSSAMNEELGAINAEHSELKNLKDGPQKEEPKPPGMR